MFGRESLRKGGGRFPPLTGYPPRYAEPPRSRSPRSTSSRLYRGGGRGGGGRGTWWGRSLSRESFIPDRLCRSLGKLRAAPPPSGGRPSERCRFARPPVSRSRLSSPVCHPLEEAAAGPPPLRDSGLRPSALFVHIVSNNLFPKRILQRNGVRQCEWHYLEDYRTRRYGSCQCRAIQTSARQPGAKHSTQTQQMQDA
jgi:hypothetical protein